MQRAELTKLRLFPHQKSLEEKGDFALEEERRLAYVGITRAKKEAFLSFAMKRAYHGDWMDALPSRFINEIPENIVEKNELTDNKIDDDFEFNQDSSKHDGKFQKMRGGFLRPGKTWCSTMIFPQTLIATLRTW